MLYNIKYITLNIIHVIYLTIKKKKKLNYNIIKPRYIPLNIINAICLTTYLKN